MPHAEPQIGPSDWVRLEQYCNRVRGLTLSGKSNEYKYKGATVIISDECYNLILSAPFPFCCHLKSLRLEQLQFAGKRNLDLAAGFIGWPLQEVSFDVGRRSPWERELAEFLLPSIVSEAASTLETLAIHFPRSDEEGSLPAVTAIMVSNSIRTARRLKYLTVGRDPHIKFLRGEVWTFLESAHHIQFLDIPFTFVPIRPLAGTPRDVFFGLLELRVLVRPGQQLRNLCDYLYYHFRIPLKTLHIRLEIKEETVTDKMVQQICAAISRSATLRTFSIDCHYSRLRTSQIVRLPSCRPLADLSILKNLESICARDFAWNLVAEDVQFLMDRPWPSTLRQLHMGNGHHLTRTNLAVPDLIPIVKRLPNLRGLTIMLAHPRPAIPAPMYSGPLPVSTSEIENLTLGDCDRDPDPQIKLSREEVRLIETLFPSLPNAGWWLLGTTFGIIVDHTAPDGEHGLSETVDNDGTNVETPSSTAGDNEGDVHAE